MSLDGRVDGSEAKTGLSAADKARVLEQLDWERRVVRVVDLFKRIYDDPEEQVSLYFDKNLRNLLEVVTDEKSQAIVYEEKESDEPIKKGSRKKVKKGFSDERIRSIKSSNDFINPLLDELILKYLSQDDDIDSETNNQSEAKQPNEECIIDPKEIFTSNDDENIEEYPYLFHPSVKELTPFDKVKNVIRDISINKEERLS
ncbi:hypothetical protein ACFL96_13380, partial [Thermoproteota archaeon]